MYLYLASESRQEQVCLQCTYDSIMWLLCCS